MKMRSLTAALAVLMVVPNVAFAQDASTLKSAIRRVPSDTRLQGNNVSGLAVRDSNRNGTIIGAVIGGAAGALAGLGWASIDENSDSVASPVVGFMALGAAAGAGVGWAADNAYHQVAYRIRVSRNVTMQLSAGSGRPIRGGLVPIHPRIRPIH